MKLGRTQLKQLFADVLRKRTTDNMFATLIDSLWRDPLQLYKEKVNVKLEYDEFGELIDPYQKSTIIPEIKYGQSLGQDNLIEGNRSIAIGQSNNTKSFLEIVCGVYATVPEDQSATEWAPADRLFTVGNGTGDALRNDALTIYKSGYSKFTNAILVGDYDHRDTVGILIDPENGTLRFTTAEKYQFWDVDHWANLGGAGSYTLPVATTTILGGVKQGAGTTIAVDGTISVSTNYQAPLSGTGFVKISGTTISYDNSTYLTAITKAMVEAVLTGLITSHTHNYDKYSKWDLQTSYGTTGVFSGSIVEFVAGSGITITDNLTAGHQILTFSASGGTMVYPGAGLAKSTGSAWDTSITDNSSNWNTAYSLRIATFTTAGNSGAATLTGNTLNIPNYTLAGLGGITLTALSCTATGLTYTNTTGVLSLTSGYGIPTTVEQGTWDEAYSNMGKVKLFGTTTYGNLSPVFFEWNLNSFQIKRDGIVQESSLLPVTSGGVYNALLLKQDTITLTNTGTSGAATLVGSTLNIPIYGGGTNYWTYASGLIRPVNNTDKVLIGGGTDMGGYIMQVTGLNKTIGQLSVDWQAGGSAYGLFANSNSNLATAHFHNSATGDGAYALSDAATGLTAEGIFGLHAIGTTSSLKVNLNTAPATATASGTTGEIRITAGYIYVCTATNTWVRAALTTW